MIKIFNKKWKFKNIGVAMAYDFVGISLLCASAFLISYGAYAVMF